MNKLNIKDKEIQEAIELEAKRQEEHIELIASENFVSADVLAVTGTILTNKYAEGYPGKRYYGGTQFVDRVEVAAIERLKKLFKVNFANVQPHSGSQANAAAIAALIQPGQKILGMSLDSGGHLTHGYKINFSGRFYQSASYPVNSEGYIDYDEVEKIAINEKPQLIICGYSAYPRTIDFKRFREIADKVGAYLMADIAHIAGLVATDVHPSPVNYAHVITSTTHKTLRGARGGIIMTNDPEIAKKVDSQVFPGQQGGPLLHIIAGKAVAFGEALHPQFKIYCEQIVKNAKAFANEFVKLGTKVVTGGTDNHLFTIDVKGSYGLTGKEAQKILEDNYITTNKNTIPRDPESPMVTSGIRLGTPAMTSRGLVESDFIEIARLIHSLLSKKVSSIENEVKAITKKFPLKESYID